jgi:hypothetical protein
MLGHALHRLVAGLVRRTWLVAITTVIVCAAFAARAVAALVEANYLGPAPLAIGSPPVVRAPAPRRSRPVADTGLVARNMFCSTCEPVRGGSGPTDAFHPDAILIATSVSDEPRATIRVIANNVQGSWGVGDALPGIGTIERIGWVSVDVVDADGRLGRLSLLDSVAAGRGDAGAATPAPAAAAEPWADRIKKIDDHTFEVERGLVRDLVSGSAKPGGVRILPVTDKGELKGLRLFGVRDGSLPAALGLKNSDLLSAVNNTPIQSANTLLDLYAKLDQLNVVELEGTRAGKPLAIELRLK